MTAKAPKIQIRKINPYPIEARLVSGSHTFTCRVLKMSMTGLLIDAIELVKVGARFELTFELPVMHAQILAKVVVVKTIDRYAAPTSLQGEGLRLAELHFVELLGPARTFVIEFLKRTGQVKV